MSKPWEVSRDHDHFLPEGRGELHRRGLHQDPLQVEGRLIVTRLFNNRNIIYFYIKKTHKNIKLLEHLVAKLKIELNMETLIVNRLPFDCGERCEIRR